MYRVLTGILIPVLAIALIGTGYWGYQENQEKNSILIKAENQYQSAFHNLNYNMEKLQEELGKTLVVNSRRQLSPSLANVWRLASIAQSEVGQLPLTLMPFNKTEEFLAKVADFSYRIAIRDLSKEPLNEKEYKTLTSLYQNSKEIRKELDHVQTNVIDKQLRWMDVEIALAEEDKQMDNTIIDGFKTIDKKVEEFPEIDWGPTITSLDEEQKEKKNVKGKLITKEEAMKRAAAFLKIESNVQLEVEETGKGTDYEVYSVSRKGKETVYLDITKHGGYVVWMMINREIKDKNLTVNQAQNKAIAFLKDHGYQSMAPINITEYDNAIIFDFVYQQNGVMIYPDLVSVKVALDNGEAVGYQSVDYIYNHRDRVIPAVKINQEAAKTKVNPNVKILNTRLTLIENFDGKEVLTYEITGKFNESVYRIYINAENGDEEMVEKVDENEFVVE